MQNDIILVCGAGNGGTVASGQPTLDKAGLAACFLGLSTLNNDLLVTGTIARRMKNYIVTGNAGRPPPGPLYLAWQRVSPVSDNPTILFQLQ